MRFLYRFAERIEGRSIQSRYARLRSHMAMPWATRAAYNRSRLIQVLERAGAVVPYYRDLFAAQGFKPECLAEDPGRLAELPALTKDILREQGDRMVAEDVDRSALHVRRTSGSTGATLPVYYTMDGLDWTAAVNLLVTEWAGRDFDKREVHFSSRLPFDIPWRDRLRERVKCHVLRRVNILTDSFDAAGLRDVWQQICDARPALVHGHPSTMYALALHVRKQGVDGRGVFGIFESTGELLSSQQRTTIGEVFRCRVCDRYGNAEIGVVAYERQNVMRVVDPVAWVESDQGELLITGLLNEAMPLIRYRIGDLGQVESDGAGLVLRGLHGRRHEVVRLGDREVPTHYIQDVLDRVGDVDLFQVARRPDRPTLLRIVPTAGCDVPALLGRVRDALGEGLAIEESDFATLQRRGWRSKFSHAVDEP